jgi:hypothetical protein
LNLYSLFPLAERWDWLELPVLDPVVNDSIALRRAIATGDMGGALSKGKAGAV